MHCVISFYRQNDMSDISGCVMDKEWKSMGSIRSDYKIILGRFLQFFLFKVQFFQSNTFFWTLQQISKLMLPNPITSVVSQLLINMLQEENYRNNIINTTTTYLFLGQIKF